MADFREYIEQLKAIELSEDKLGTSRRLAVAC